MTSGLQVVMGVELLAFFALRLVYEPVQARSEFQIMERGWFRFVMSAVALAQILVLAGAVLLPTRFDFASIAIPEIVRWFGAGLGVLVLGGLSWTYRYLGDNYHSILHVPPNQKLVTDGPYRRVRHPLYSGLYLIFLAFTLQAANWLVLVLGIGGLTLLLWVRIPKEEALLLTHFGSAYQTYMKRTNRFFP